MVQEADRNFIIIGKENNMHKKLKEKKNALLETLKNLTDTLQTEERSFTDEENKQYEEIKAEIVSINKTLEALGEMRDFGDPEPVNPEEPKQETQEEREIREFAHYLRTSSVPETRENEQNFTLGANGALIPTTIAKMVITKIKEICPILAGATIFHVKGTLQIPSYGPDPETGNDITVGYSDDFVELTANAGKFTSIDLTGHLIGALTLIGKRLVNNSDIALVSFVVNYMARSFSVFVEKELLTASGDKMKGAINTTNGITAAAQSAITADELIDLQASIKQAFQTGACWTMNSKTFGEIKKLKDGNDRYLLQDDVTKEFPYRLLGKPIYISDNMPDMGAGAKPILYGNYDGLAVNIREELSVQILREKYATQHAIGIVGWMELDCKVMDEQRLAVLTMAGA